MKIKYLSRKEEIILSAIDIIDKLGIDGLSIRELASREHITEGAIYRHFKSKNDIIIEAIKYYSHFDLNIMNTINQSDFDSKSSIIFFINSFSEYYENYPEITSISCSFQSLIYEPSIMQEVLYILNRRLDFIITLIEKGKNNGEFSEDINSENIADIIFGYFSHIVFKWRVEKYRFSLKEKSLDTINFILKSALTSN